MSKPTGAYPSLKLDATGAGIVSQAGATLLVDAAVKIGLDRALSQALARWRHPGAIHDPGKSLCDLAISLALGGDCLADIATLRAEPGVFGLVASDPTVSRLLTTLADDIDIALAALNSARAQVRATAWELAGAHAPDHGIDADHPLIVDLDATLVTAHSDKQDAAPTFKKGFGFHPCAGSSTTAPREPGNRWRSCCAPARPARTPPADPRACGEPPWAGRDRV